MKEKKTSKGEMNMLREGREQIEERRRIATWWLRWEDLGWPSHDGMDRIKQRAEKMAKANVSAAMLFGTHFRWDFLPYFTILHDYIATVAEELHKNGVMLYDHHSVNLVHRYDTREQMRHVMLHSGPHLPFSPSREAAAAWTYRGKRLNDWLMRDVRDGSALYYPQYAAEGFCYRNPDFIDAYCDYVKRLVADTGIDGLSADDPVQYMHYSSCGCAHCRAELRRRTGLELPPVDDRSFWFNWENEVWHRWLDVRFDASADFLRRVSQVLPEGFMLTTCGGDSASPSANAKASDALCFMAGCNYVNLEMSGNTPPYKHDPVTVNKTVAERMINSSHHQAAARKAGYRCFGTGFGFTEQTADMVWAVNKAIDSDCWFSTLKDRLGLPEHILRTLPDEQDIVGHAFTFEKEHSFLFDGKQIGQLGVYFSYETRNYTYFGNVFKGYYRDYCYALRMLFNRGISAHTVFEFPESPEMYPVIILPSVARMSEGEMAAMRAYLANGGKVIVTGPSPLPECQNRWVLPKAPDEADPMACFSSIVNGVKHKAAPWMLDTEITPSDDEDVWQEPHSGLHYHPYRMSDGVLDGHILSLCERYIKPLPVKLLRSDGYLITMFRGESGLNVHLLAEDYDTDVDHHLDEIRFHRSRVNYINKVEPVGVTQTLCLRADRAPSVFTPLNDAPVSVTAEGDTYTVSLPQKTAYIILHFPD